MTTSIAIAIAAGIILAGVMLAVGYSILRKKVDVERAGIRADADKALAEAKGQAEAKIREADIEAKEKVLAARVEFDKTVQARRVEIAGLEKRVQQKEENLDRKLTQQEKREEEYARKEKSISDQQKKLEDMQGEVQKVIDEQRKRLEQISGLTAVDAKRDLIKSVENEARLEAAGLMRRIEEEATEQATQKARRVIGMAIQRMASDTVVEATVSVVELPSDELKGRIIGREGRNIRALEAATGIDLIIDDTPEAVILSGFNPVRREVARLSPEKLIGDGRIHPGRIEEVVAKATEEVELTIKEAGEQAAFDLGVHGIHPEILKLIGRLKYRTSYTQNVYLHSLEVAFLCGIMAAELGINVKQAKRAGLLHDLGKAVDHEVEGSHAVIGAELARKYGESPKIVHAIMAHHEDEKPNSVLAVLVQAADALSGARPGARREMMETYVKRLEDLERISTSFGGVTNAFAIQAGREIRVMVSSEDVSDDRAVVLAKDVAKKIEAEMTYPGQIKVNVIRETRAIEYAR